MTKREEGKDTGQGQRAFGASLANAATPPTPPPRPPPCPPPLPLTSSRDYTMRTYHVPGTLQGCVIHA